MFRTLQNYFTNHSRNSLNNYFNFMNNQKLFYGVLGQSKKQKMLVIHPQDSLQDEEISIEVHGAEANKNYTITSSVQDRPDQTFFTYSHFVSNSNGYVNVSQDHSLGGSWEGQFPMGSIAALKPAPGTRKYQRFVKKEVFAPLKVNYQLLHGHLDLNEAINPNQNLVLDECFTHRQYLKTGTSRIAIKIGRIRGTLFMPEGIGPFPAVVDLFGTGGGLMEFRAAQLASRGIAALALAYFGYDDLPESPTDSLDIDYFKEATDYLLSLDKVSKKGVGAIGVSKGGDLACAMGTYIDEVKAVVCINGFAVNTWCPLITGTGATLPGLMFDVSKGKPLNEELIMTREMMDNSDDYPDTHIPIHESNADYLFVVGLDDQNWPMDEEMVRMERRLQDTNWNNYKILRYENAGHLIEPPYAPFSYATFHKMIGTSMVWGGNAKEHTNAQVDAWQQTLNFFKSKLA